MSVLLSVLVVLGAQSGTSLPAEAAEPIGGYLSCLYDPVEQVLATGLPKDKSARSAIVAQELARCLPTRITTAAQIDHRPSSLAEWRSESARKARIDAVLSAIGRQYRFMVVEREKFVEANFAYEKCIHEKGMDKC